MTNPKNKEKTYPEKEQHNEDMPEPKEDNCTEEPDEEGDSVGGGATTLDDGSNPDPNKPRPPQP